MQAKKNPKADLNKDRNLYFVIGLTLVLGVTWGAIEYICTMQESNLM